MMEIHGYTENGSIDATFNGQRMTVPDDMSNRHRRMIAEWEAEGNTIPSYEAPAPSTDPNDYNLSRRQIRVALVQAGKSASYVDDLINAMPEGAKKEVAKIDWQDAPYYSWSHPLTVALMASLSEWTDAEMAAMWVAASQLPR